MLELASFVTEGGTVLESGRTAALTVIFGTTGGLVPSPAETRFTTAEGSELVVERVVDGLVDPSDLAFGPDGVVFVAERSGRVHAVRNGVVSRDAALDLSSEIALPAGGLLAIALDPKFSETGFLYTLYAARAPHDGQEFVLARFRGVRDVFGERAVLLDRVAASPAGASGALRIGPDGKVYVALDNAADLATSGSLASYNGKVLRLNADATVPRDQALATPVYSLHHPQPKAFDWQPASGRLWVVDELNDFAGRLIRTDVDLQQRPTPRVSYALPEGTGPASAAFYRGDLLPQFKGDLFIAAAAGRQLIRLRFDPAEPGRIASVDRLLQDALGPLQVVAPAPDGALYLTSDTTLYRMRPVN
jgi:glucose/arabinose dehydrogenase